MFEELQGAAAQAARADALAAELAAARAEVAAVRRQLSRDVRWALSP
jgi:hypothetical protein